MRIVRFPFACDGCGEPINCLSDAMVEWIEIEAGVAEEVRVVHNGGVSPMRPLGAYCYAHTWHRNRKDHHLSVLLVAPAELYKLDLGVELQDADLPMLQEDMLDRLEFWGMAKEKRVEFAVKRFPWLSRRSGLWVNGRATVEPIDYLTGGSGRGVYHVPAY